MNTSFEYGDDPAAAVKAWKAKIPAEAKGLQDRLDGALLALTLTPDIGKSQLDALKEDLPVLEEFYTELDRARKVIQELGQERPVNGVVDTAIREWTREQLQLFDHIVRMVRDRKGAAPVRAQVEQIRQWGRSRRKAVGYIRGLTELRDASMPGERQSLTDIASAWSDQFRQARISEDWLEEAETLLKKLEANRPQAPQVTPPPAKTPQTSDAQAHSASPSAPSVVVAQAESRDALIDKISQILAIYQDSAQVLDPEGHELKALDDRLWELRQNNTQKDQAALQSLLADVETFADKLALQADKEKDEQLKVLGRRWERFQGLYAFAADPDIEGLVKEAVDAKSLPANELNSFYRTVEEALNRIYNTVDGNRSLLNTAIGASLGSCREAIAKLRSQPRTRDLENRLAKMESSLPDDRHLPPGSKESFECLDLCDGISLQLIDLTALNDQAKRNLDTQIDEILSFASNLQRLNEAAEAGNIAKQIEGISKQMPVTAWLDDTDRQLELTKAELGKIADRALRKSAERLKRLNKENNDWIDAISEFTPEVRVFRGAGNTPQGLQDMLAAIDTATLAANEIKRLKPEAVSSVAKKQLQVLTSLQDILKRPAFERHPERQDAEGWLQELIGLTAVSEQTPLDEFTVSVELLADVASFVDRLESVRLDITLRLNALNEQFADLRDLNAASYRPAVASRVNVLLMGAGRAVRNEDFESLKHQVEEIEKLIRALRSDVIKRIAAVTERGTNTVKAAIGNSSNENFKAKAMAVLELLEGGDTSRPPSHTIRRRLERVLSETVINQQLRRNG